MQKQIIEKPAQKMTPELAAHDLELLEPAFLSDQMLAEFSKSKSAEKIIDFMAQQIVRNPTNLQFHLKRINFNSKENNHQGIYAALLDLFFVLKKNGLPLRKRLLQKYHKQLEPEHRRILISFLSAKRYEKGIIPQVKESRLNNGRTGTCEILLKQTRHRDAEVRDVVADARDLIDSGQIGAATVLLKKALLVNPEREDISQELIIIYRHSRNLHAVQSLLQCTRHLSLALQSQWDELVLWLKEKAEKGNG